MDAEGWNLTRFDKGTVDPAKGHLESTFVKLNDPSGKRALWVKATIFAPTERTSGGPPHERGRTVAESWAIAFDRLPDDAPPISYREAVHARAGGAGEGAPLRHVAVKRTVAVEEATLARTRPYHLEWAGVSFDGRRLVGEIEHGAAAIRFDLELSARDPSPLVHFPFPSMYEGRFPKSKLVSPIFDALASGEIEVRRKDGRRTWEVKDWPAMEGHNWGVGHADLYAWAHVNAWNEPEGRGVVLEGFSGKVKVGRLTTPLVSLVALRHKGVRYEVHGALDLARTRGRIERLRRWEFSAHQAGATIEGDIELTPDDTVGLYYPNPTGEMTYCLNSKIARARLRFTPRGRAPLVLTSDAAALEIGTHDPRHGIRMYV